MNISSKEILSFSNKMQSTDENKQSAKLITITETTNNMIKLNASLRHFSIQVPLYPDSEKSQIL